MFNLINMYNFPDLTFSSNFNQEKSKRIIRKQDWKSRENKTSFVLGFTQI